MKFTSLSATVWAMVCMFKSPLVWTHEINTSHCDTDTFTNEVSGLKCDQKYIQFKSNGLPASDHILMEGIIATNQQFPTEHSYQFKINRKPKQLVIKKIPDAGPIGVAVNGIPIFDPATQGPANKRTGKRPSALDAGELDECGGHAGRGDDYHYHIAPNCLIEQLGMQKVEIEKKPIGFSMDIIWNRNEEYFLKSDWRGSKKKDGGILYTQFSHYLDLIEWLFGKIDYSYGSIENLLHKKVSDTEDSICLSLGRKNEFSGVAHFSINAYKKNLGNRFTIIFEKGHIILEGQNFDNIVFENGKTSFPKIKPNLKKLFDKKNTTNLHDRFYVYLDRFLKSNSNDKLNLLATGDDGLKNLFFIESLYKKIK